MASAKAQSAVCNSVPTAPVRPLLQIQNPYGIVFVGPPVADEADAEAAGRGLWSGEFVPP